MSPTSPPPTLDPSTPSSDRCPPPIASYASSERHAEGVGQDTVDNELTARAATMLPPELVQPGEIIILLLKPSPLFILLAPLGTVAGLVVLTAAAVWVNEVLDLSIGRQDLILIGAGLIGLRLFWQFLEWLSRVYVLTDRRMIRVQGVLRVSVIEAPLQQIQQTYATFSIRERLFGLGTIAFATAGTAFVEAYWQMIAKPLEVHQKVVQTINRYGGRR